MVLITIIALTTFAADPISAGIHPMYRHLLALASGVVVLLGAGVVVTLQLGC